MQTTIDELWIYPIKGCQGLRLSCAQALTTGLQNDRLWMVVRADSGQMISQRTHPRMALIAPRLEGSVLHVCLAGMMDAAFDTRAAHASKTVTVWRSTLPALDMGDAAAQWFSAALGIDARLVRFDSAQQRLTRSAAPGQPEAAYHFADGYPYLVLSQASVDALNERLLEAGSPAIRADRFRANIVLGGVEPHTEDYAASLHHVSGTALHIVSPCVRCTVPTINQQTAVPSVDHQPTLAMAQYRYNKAQDGLVFGMNATLSGATMLTEGDRLSVALAF
jgi:uncharacterized protein